MREFGWTINDVDDQPYERLMSLIIDKGKKDKQNEVMSGADFIKNL